MKKLTKATIHKLYENCPRRDRLFLLRRIDCNLDTPDENKKTDEAIILFYGEPVRRYFVGASVYINTEIIEWTDKVCVIYTSHNMREHNIFPIIK